MIKRIKRSRVRAGGLTGGMAAAFTMFLCTTAFVAPAAATQAPLATPNPPVPEAPPPPAPPLDAVAPVVAPPAAAQPAGTDHDSIVGRWGIEVRRLATFQRTRGQELGCETDCPVDMNALSLRKWSRNDYAYSIGLALGAGGGSSRPVPTEGAKTWDTFMGFGPTLAANFLMADWKHLAVSFSPQFDFLFFLPSSKGSKSFLFNLRGVIEAELHLGMIGLPEASLAASSGLAASYLIATKDDKPMPVANGTASKWSVGFTGPGALWDLVTDIQLRYYF
jgi:hypothetical protein